MHSHSGARPALSRSASYGSAEPSVAPGTLRPAASDASMPAANGYRAHRDKMANFEKILAGLANHKPATHPSSNSSSVSGNGVPWPAAPPTPRRSSSPNELPASRAGNYNDAGFAFPLDADLDGDEEFGVPERYLSRLPNRHSALYQPPASVIDACVLCDEEGLCDILKKGVTKVALNRRDPKTGRTGLAYASAQGYLGILDILVGMGPILDVNAPDNEGNTPLHLAAEAGHADVLSNLLAFFRDVQIDMRNHSGLTPLMKAAIQGRTNCAKILLFAGACPALRDGGRCLCASEWARLCGRHSAAEIIDRFPHTSCLLHPVVSSHGMSHTDRAARSAHAHTVTGPSPRTPQGTRRVVSPARENNRQLVVRRTQRAASEPNLQSRGSVQLEQLHSAGSARYKASWIRRTLARAFGPRAESPKERRSASLHPANIADQLQYASSPSLQGLVANVPFACYTGSEQRSHSASNGTRPRSPMVIPKVKIHHSDSECDSPMQPDITERKHKLNLKKVMLFRKRSSSSSKLKKI